MYYAIECGDRNISLIYKFYDENIRFISFTSQYLERCHKPPWHKMKAHIQNTLDEYRIHVDINKCATAFTTSGETKYIYNVVNNSSMIIVSENSGFSDVYHEFGHFVFFNLIKEKERKITKVAMSILGESFAILFEMFGLSYNYDKIGIRRLYSWQDFNTPPVFSFLKKENGGFD